VIKKGLKKYEDFGLGSWMKNPIKKGCEISHYQNDKVYALKCEFRLNNSFSETILFFEDSGEETVQT
jgi:hypothetical protein